MTPSGSNPNLKTALRRYRAGLFTDADVTRFAGLSARSVRELIKIGAVRTLSMDRGPGRIRMFDAPTFKRLALVAAVHEAGINLQLAGQIAYVLPYSDLLDLTCDPIAALDDTANLEPDTELPAHLAKARAEWFDRNRPAAADAENDTLIEIYEGRFVAVVTQNKRHRVAFGELQDHGTSFVWWAGHALLFDSTKTGLAAKWEARQAAVVEIDPKLLNYQFQIHDSIDDFMLRAAYTAVWRPIRTNTINVSLAIRLALRRYLGLEPLTNFQVVGPIQAKHDRVADGQVKLGKA